MSKARKKQKPEAEAKGSEYVPRGIEIVPRGTMQKRVRKKIFPHFLDVYFRAFPQWAGNCFNLGILSKLNAAFRYINSVEVVDSDWVR